MRFLALTVSIALGLGGAPVSAQAEQCQALSGNVQIPAPRFVYAIRDPAAAVEACRSALDAAPDDAVLALLLARARIALDADDPEVLGLLRQARERRMALADWMIGQLYEFGFAGLPPNERQARDLYTAICASLWPAPDAAPACTALAVMRIEGRGGPADETGGFNLLRNLCDTGHGLACTEAAFQGELRGDAEPSRIAALLAQGCEAGDLLACSQYGFRLELGEGVAADVRAARAFYERACDGGEPQGCSNLGEVYRSGLGVRPDMEQALRLFDLGCAGHDSYACMTLGDILANGRGVAMDRPRARALFENACALGDAEGCDLAEVLR